MREVWSDVRGDAELCAEMRGAVRSRRRRTGSVRRQRQLLDPNCGKMLDKGNLSRRRKRRAEAAGAAQGESWWDAGMGGMLGIPLETQKLWRWFVQESTWEWDQELGRGSGGTIPAWEKG